MDFNKIILNAQHSSFGRWKLNFLLHRYIPFNRPHKIKIISLDKNRVEVKLPFIKNNKNHINGLHACGMATAAEFSSGFLLLSRLNIKKYRLIMESLNVEYYYQGKSAATAIFSITDEEIQKNILNPLEHQDKVSYKCTVQIMDADKNQLCTANMNWQIKNWQKVKVK